MGFNVGMPTVKLDRRMNHSKNSRTKNARAVANEGLEERHTSDPDLNREKSGQNIYYRIGDKHFTSGNKLADYWEEMAENYRIIDKNGTSKKLRSDAIIGMSGVCKPEKEFMDTLTLEEQEKFLYDSACVISEILPQYGIELDAIVAQFDEMNPHLHFFGHDPEYKLGRKVGLPLFSALNQKYPEKMRKLGWDVNTLQSYDVAATKDMNEEELAEYKKQHIARKKKGGKPAAVYKAEKDAKRILDAAQQQATDIIREANEERAAANILETRLKAQISDFNAEKAKYIDEAKKIVKSASTALQSATSLDKACKSQLMSEHYDEYVDVCKSFDEEWKPLNKALTWVDGQTKTNKTTTNNSDLSKKTIQKPRRGQEFNHIIKPAGSGSHNRQLGD